ncbi:MAG: hydroxymethylbilane synthase, partial [bacterium]|nr:hydroxymethylbilane synthase [bacterium]
MSKRRIVIGSRGSRLALTQSEIVKSLLVQQHTDLSVDIKIIKTKGDVILDTPLAKIGDKGLF